MKFNKGFIVIGIITILGTGIFLRGIYDPSIERIPVNWGLTGEANYFASNTPIQLLLILLIQVLFLWVFVYFYALCQRETLMIPSNFTLVSKAKKVQLSPKQWLLLKLTTIPLGLICLLNFTYLGYASQKVFERINPISLFCVLLSFMVLGLVIYSDQNFKNETQNKKR